MATPQHQPIAVLRSDACLNQSPSCSEQWTILSIFTSLVFTLNNSTKVANTNSHCTYLSHNQQPQFYFWVTKSGDTQIYDGVSHLTLPAEGDSWEDN